MDYTGFQVGNLPCCYLGIPLSGVYLKLEDYAPLFDKVTKTLLAWAGLNLSYAGWLELGILPPSVAVMDRIASLCRRFLWGGNVAKVAWKTLCCQKQQGGLGLRESKKWNDALLSKALWNVHNKKNTLWCRWIQHYYIKDSTIWEILPKKDFPPLVKCLLDSRYVIFQAEGTVGAAMDRVSDWVKGDIFQTAAAYTYFSPARPKQSWAKIVWNPTFPPKFSFIMWLTVLGRLLMMDRLKFLEVDRTCNLCKQNKETLSHLLFACPFTGDIWTAVQEWAGLRRRMTTMQSCLK
ncbi:hypothetical protein M9H77_23208 [Catharanthus roseus]|uniref:Uncharacterized protein n=1 Tax=Catharanthus roseus TaxID=4058 RepID=A0ACC0AU67_CATRO|nr:hypothetical protein M9H77_23208 [Catharanthus roseus]